MPVTERDIKRAIMKLVGEKERFDQRWAIHANVRVDFTI